MDNKKVTMTIKEIKRVEVMTLIETGKITGSQAAKMMVSPFLIRSNEALMSININ